jgi:hypothetical protein
VEFFADDNVSLGICYSPTYTTNWFPVLQSAHPLAALATDNQGNSQYSATVTSFAHLDSNGDGIPDYLQIQDGNDPLNPWSAPTPDTNDHSAPVITLLIPTNAVVVP